MRRGLSWLAFSIVAILIIWMVVRLQEANPMVVSECRRLYGRARTAADTAAVDAQRPVVGRGQATIAASCGLFRKTGRL
jgi:hypothetical protein